VENGGAIYTFDSGYIIIYRYNALAFRIVGVDELSLVMDTWDSTDNIVPIVGWPESAVGYELVSIRHKHIYPIRTDSFTS
jgi:hypothetical protein